MKRKMYTLILLVIILLGIPQRTLADERKLEFEVVDTTGDWDVTTPMYFETTDPNSYKFAQVNATNINDTNVLNSFQYMKYIIDFVDYELPTVSKTDIDLVFYNIINFTDDSKVLRVSYGWSLEYDTGVVLYEGNLRLFVDSHLVFNEYFNGYEESHQLEIQIWRTKSAQLGVYYKAGEETTEDGLEILDSLIEWNIGNMTYWVSDDETNTGYFSLKFEQLSIQSGVDEGIADPVENPDWGFFDPIRQILMFIINVFVGLVKVILPGSLEDFFDTLLDALGDFMAPLTDIAEFILENFLDLLILGNLALVLSGLRKMEDGDVAGVFMPIWSFYSTIFSIGFTVIGFIMSVIKAFVEALPL